MLQSPEDAVTGGVMKDSAPVRPCRQLSAMCPPDVELEDLAGRVRLRRDPELDALDFLHLVG